MNSTIISSMPIQLSGYQKGGKLEAKADRLYTLLIPAFLNYAYEKIWINNTKLQFAFNNVWLNITHPHTTKSFVFLIGVIYDCSSCFEVVAIVKTEVVL